ncbi:Fic/DOC family protein [Lactobacillus amylovorus]|uniref:Fic/DOC family protein n=1 Tax=Lactobacillus amylovorus TaxID=1604 RepID=UPI0021A35D7E|nr:Fic family protein [Lactobacillus amylovorus]
MSDWIQETLYANGTLINKLGIRDAQDLAKNEFEITAQRELFLLNQGIKIKDISAFAKINAFLFSPLYDWAGKYRQGNFYKGNTTFLDYNRFNYAEEDINHVMSLQQKQHHLTAEDLMDLLNYMHPFREGNGRSTRLFLQCYAVNHGQYIIFPLTNDNLIQALTDADVAKIAKLIKIENV